MTRPPRRSTTVQLILVCFLLIQSTLPIHSSASQRDNNPQEIKRLKEEADKLSSARKYDEAIAVLTRALEALERTPNIPPLEVASTLSDLGELAFAAGKYDSGASFMSRSLMIREKILVPDDPLLGETLSNLATLYIKQGDLVTSEPLLQRALSIEEKQLGPDHLDVSTTVAALATLYEDRGDRKTAEPLHKRALAIREKARPERPDLVAKSLNNLGRLYMANRDFLKAESMYKRSLEIREALLKPDNPELAVPIGNLANLYYEMGEFEKSASFFQRALRLQENALSSNHPALINTLLGLAEVNRHRRQFTEAETFYKRALDVATNSLGNEHTLVATVLRSYALLQEARSDFAQTASLLQRAINIQEQNLELMLTAGSQSQKLLYLRTVADEADIALSLHLRNAPRNSTAQRLALTTLLQRKGRVLDVMSASIDALRQRALPQDLDLINQLAQARNDLAKLTFTVPGQITDTTQTKIVELERKIAQLEAEISVRSSRFRVQSEPVTIERVQQAIPANSSLVEFVSYKPFNVFGKTRTESFGAVNYAAYILNSSGSPSFVPLGEATKIDRAVTRFRQSLTSSRTTTHRRTGRALDELVMRPVRRFVGTKQRLFISPDGVLNLIPFAALVDERNRYLAEKYAITYLSSGRDLLRLQVTAPAKQPPVVIANPAFHDVGVQESSVASASRSIIDFRTITVDPLPETALEAEAFKTLFPDAEMFTGKFATEAVLKQVRTPSILHVATHGFFMSDKASVSGTRSVAISSAESGPNNDPLLRAGLLLAGVSLGKSGKGEDGILTALELANLNLWGTKLVVLSACETGLGDVYVGEGVFGLRRALVLAGAESQMISLWRVSDLGTRELMTSYYKAIQKGASRADALRDVQLQMINGRMAQARFRHPFYWASFIQSGDWRSFSRG